MGWYNKKDAEKPVLPEGDYDAVIEKVTQETSKKGQDMRKLQVRVYGDGVETLLFDYLGGFAAWKIKDLACALGAEKEFDAEVFEPGKYEGESVTVTLAIEENPQYGKQNKITGYDPSRLTRRRAAGGPAPEATNKGTDADDIVVPF